MKRTPGILKVMAVTSAIFLAMGNLAPAIAAINVAEKNLTLANVDRCYWPEISGNYVVYNDYLPGPSSVYLYNIAAETTTIIGLAGASNDNPSIDSDRVVYSSDSGDGHSIRMYTILSGQDVEITKVNHGDSRPAISGHNIVYRNGPDSRNGNAIYLIDLNDVTLTPHQISAKYASNFRPMIDGNYVVWHASNGADNDVMLYDINAGTESIIAQTADDEERPDVSGDNVVYHVNAGDDGLRLYNITSKTTIQLVPPGYAFTPRIQGNYVIYEGGLTSGNQKVILYNLTTGAETTLADPGDALDIPTIDGNHVAWVTDGADVMLDTLAGTPVFAALPGSGALINLTAGQVITSNPYTILVHPTIDFGTIDRVEFFVDGVLIGTSKTPDANGVYSMNWDTSIYHSTVKVIAYNKTGQSTTLAEVTVQVGLPYAGK